MTTQPDFPQLFHQIKATAASIDDEIPFNELPDGSAVVALVYVAGEARPTVVEKKGACYYTKAPIQYRHRTGTKTYTHYYSQLSLGRDGKFRPVAAEFLRRPALPVAWGFGNSERNY